MVWYCTTLYCSILYYAIGFSRFMINEAIPKCVAMTGLAPSSLSRQDLNLHVLPCRQVPDPLGHKNGTLPLSYMASDKCGWELSHTGRYFAIKSAIEFILLNTTALRTFYLLDLLIFYEFGTFEGPQPFWRKNKFCNNGLVFGKPPPPLDGQRPHLNKRLTMTRFDPATP